MKKLLAPTRKTEGSTLIVTVVVTALIGLVLAAYLSLIKHQNVTTYRSQTWNSAMPIIEAGLEHALAHLNANIGVNLARDGWSAVGSTFVTTNSIGNDGYYAVITNYVPSTRFTTPEVYSVAYVQVPLVAAVPAPGPFLAQVVGGSTTGGNSSPRPQISRAVHIRCRLDALYTKGLLAKDRIDFFGNNVNTDSYDSTDPNYSTNGKWDPTKPRKANGDIASNSSITNSLSLGNANIYGHVSTGPDGSFSVGSNGRVGDTNFVAVGTNRIQAGWFKDDMNVEILDNVLPFDPNSGVSPLRNVTRTNYVAGTLTNNLNSLTYPSGATSPVTTNSVTTSTYPLGSSGPITTNWSNNGTRVDSYTYPVYRYYTTAPTTNAVVTTYDWYLDRDNCVYRMPGNGDLSGKIYVAGQNTKLLVEGTINVTGGDYLDIGEGKSLTLYMAGASASFGGNGVFNRSGNVTNFTYIGLPANTNLSISGNGTFYGVINAPNAFLQLNGGGSLDEDFCGAAIVKSSQLNGHFNFHYDEALQKFGPNRGYIVSSWNEITPSEIRRLMTYQTTGNTTPTYPDGYVPPR